MREKEEIIRNMAYAIHADMRYGIKPASHDASVEWLNLALAWARRHNRKALEKEIMEYLCTRTEYELEPTEMLAQAI